MKGLRKKIRMRPYLRWLLVFSNWFSQGIIHADKTEKIYKILFSIISVFFFFAVFVSCFKMPLGQSILAGTFSGHTLNWLLNGNFYIIIVHRLFLSNLDKQNAFNYLDSLADRLQNNHSIVYATAHGSICTGKLKPSSDIDVALVRAKGFRNALQALFFVTCERKIADLMGIPLEIYLIDNPDVAVKRFKAEQNPVVIFDPKDTVDRYYNEKISIAEARKLNGL